MRKIPTCRAVVVVHAGLEQAQPKPNRPAPMCQHVAGRRGRRRRSERPAIATWHLVLTFFLCLDTRRSVVDSVAGLTTVHAFFFSFLF